jgi:hypothetical protein
MSGIKILPIFNCFTPALLSNYKKKKFWERKRYFLHFYFSNLLLYLRELFAFTKAQILFAFNKSIFFVCLYDDGKLAQ